MSSNQPIAIVDVRGLKCPEPFRQATSTAMALPPGGSFQLHISVEPQPLYEHLNELGFTIHPETASDGDFLITITAPDNPVENSEEILKSRPICIS